MSASRIGYVVKRYPRFSETFIVNEILAHEACDVSLDIFSLRTSNDSHFQNSISEVRAPVNYLQAGSIKASLFYDTCRELGQHFPNLWEVVSQEHHAGVTEVYQAMELARSATNRKISHLHAHFATSAAAVARIAAKIMNITYSITMHAKDIFHDSVVDDDLQRKIADAKFVVTVSDFNRQFLVSKFGMEQKIIRVYNGLDLNQFAFQPHLSRSRKIVAVGRLVEKKGFSTLVDACRILADRGVEFECEIIGSGDLQTDLAEQISDLGLQSLVKLPGSCPQNVVRQRIGNAAIFAAPCVIGADGNRDGLPTVITESMALGTPCIATDVTGIPEIVRQGITGVIVEQRNPDELARELERLLDSPDERQRLRSAARRLIEQEFEIHANASRIRSMFPETVGDTQVPAPKAMLAKQGV